MLRLPPGVTRVLRASRVLSDGQKLVWMEDWILDRGPEGSWLDHAKLAARLAFSAETVEAYRRRLEGWGLYWRHPRSGAGSPGWCPMIPKACWPHSQTPQAIAAAVARLDADLRGRGAPGYAKRRGVLPQEANRDSPESVPPSPQKRTTIPQKANGGTPEARPSTAFDSASEPLGEHSPSTAFGSELQKGNRVSAHAQTAKAIDPAVDLSLKLIEARVATGVWTRERADIERRRVLGV